CEVSYAPNFGAKGLTEYRKTLEGIGSYFAATSHHVSNIAVDFVGDEEAHVRSVVLAVHRYTRERPDGWLFGQYHDVVVKQEGRWKFKRRELRTTMAAAYHVKTANPIGRAP
ncbi:MAG TPA: nuclear transport factor 2 family protein, partial [Polyangia bacterium]